MKSNELIHKLKAHNDRFKMKFAAFLFLTLIAYGCGVSNQEISPEKQAYYEQSKKNLNPDLINHFPKKLGSEVVTIQFHQEIEKNDVSFMLYEFELSQQQIESIRGKFEAIDGVKKYNSTDSNLLYAIPDGAESETGFRHKNCLNYSQTLLPVAAMSYYPSGNPELNKIINGECDVYVIEARPDKVAEFPDLRPSVNMPPKWRNGMSKGVSINEKDKMVVYWTVVW